MARKYNKAGIFGSPGDFDIDEDGEYCGVIGGEMADRHTVGPAWDWQPDMSNPQPAQHCRVLGQLDMNEFHTARAGTPMDGSYSASGRQINPVDRGTIEMFRGGPGSEDPVRVGSEKFGSREGPGSPDPVRAGSMQHGGAMNRNGGMNPARMGTKPYGERTMGGQMDPARRGTRK